jgi:hypothetical protein
MTSDNIYSYLFSVEIQFLYKAPQVMFVFLVYSSVLQKVKESRIYFVA